MHSGRNHATGWDDKRGSELRLRLPGLLCLMAVLLVSTVLAYSCGEGEGGPGQIKLPPELSAKFGSLTESSLEPYAAKDIEEIKVNYLHQRHNFAGLECAACHKDTEPFTVQQQLDLCADCHNDEDPRFFVSRELWTNHCYVCHQFTGDRIEEKSFVPDIETCKACHEYKDAGPYIFGFYSHNMKSEMACRTCHKPHDNPPVFATDNCSSCHGVFFENEFMKGGHISCSLCHTPHWWKAPDDLDCTQCHSADPSVLAHKLPFHPKDCLECHNPHFKDTEFAGGQCQSCHDNLQFNFAANVPEAHMNCTNCHSGDNFSFKGVGTCRSCHTDKAEALAQDFVPDKHQQCTSCHQPHTWKASFANSCQQCHDLDSVVEHQVPYHPKDCATCHDPHMAFETPKSGQCNDCHGADTFPAFAANLPPQHVNCGNCHTPDSGSGHKFEFVGDEDSCMLCHASPPDGDGLEWDMVPAGHTMCTACHQPHTWKPQFGENTCGICHAAETAGVAGNVMHQDCRSCHLAGHTMKFAGKENSCFLCHAEVVEQGEPLGKDDCFLCHTQHEFTVDDANTCTVCHSSVPDTGKDWDSVPAGHTTCSGCHQPHKWQPATDGPTCTACHTDVGTATAGNAMHGECMNCHSPGHEMQFAGTGDSCALCHADIDELMTPMGKNDCTICHTQHSFAADTQVCSACHTDLFATHNSAGHSECLNCHQLHSFEPDRTVCEVCHTDREDHHPEVRDCVRCHIFRRGG